MKKKTRMIPVIPSMHSSVLKKHRDALCVSEMYLVVLFVPCHRNLNGSFRVGSNFC